MEASDAYRHCEQITRQEAKNFSYGIALLPGDKRRALSAVYAFARRIDDIGDGALPADEKIKELGEARAAVLSLETADPDDLVLVALRDAAARFPIPVGAFGELLFVDRIGRDDVLIHERLDARADLDRLLARRRQHRNGHA